MASNTFHAKERLKSHVTIERLFKEGKSFGMYPLRVVWVTTEVGANESPAQFALSVPKKSFKKAVDRNRLRRKIREAYRLHKADFYTNFPPSSEGKNIQCALMVIYTAKEPLPYTQIETAMVKMLKQLTQRLK